MTNSSDIEKHSFLDCSLSYNKTFEEEVEEMEKVSLAERYLENLGIKVRTNYGYYRNVYDILLELGEYWSKNNT